MLRVVEKNIRDTLSENQFGIKKNMSTREAISILGIIIENEYEKINRHLLPLLTLNRRSIMLTKVLCSKYKKELEKQSLKEK